MINNDVLRSIRYTLDLSDAKVAELIHLAEHEISPTDITPLLKKEDEEGFVECEDAIMVAFLDGLIIHKRGKMEPRPAQEKKRD